MADAVYEQRYCAYLDVLGFRGLVNGIKTGEVSFQTVRDLLKKIHEPDNPYIQTSAKDDFRAQSVSDAVVMSTRFSATGLAMILDTIERLSLNLLVEGYFTRGGVCYGLLYHDDQTVFGDALVEAYRMESEVARYPRVMLTKDVIDSAKRTNLAHYFDDHVMRAEDGPYYLHSLWRLQKLLEHQDAPLGFDVAAIDAIRNRIQERYDQAVDEPRHFEKVKWFALYWNDAMCKYGEKYRIRGPGLHMKYVE